VACDICGKTGAYLEDIRDIYKTDSIQNICSECSSEVNGHLSKLRVMTYEIQQHWLKKFMQNMKSKFAV